MRRFLTSSLAVFALMLAAVAQAEPTRIEVSALAHGAKFIGDRSGGARVTVADAETGAVLAEGITTGGTGDTQLIMKQSRPRWQPLTSADAGSFMATMDIDAPRHIAITVSGPLDARPGDQVRASMTTWLLPGAHLEGGQRVVIELTGYLVELLELDMEKGVSAFVNIGMLCGCPVMPGGLWDANRIDMQATLSGSRGEETVALEHVEGTHYRARFGDDTGTPHSLEIRLRGLDDSNTAVFRQAIH